MSVIINSLTNSLFPFENHKGDELTFSEWAKLVRNFMPEVIKCLPIPPYTNIEDLNLKAQHGKGGELVIDNVRMFNTTNIFRTTTIHGVKGETLESVMVVSSLDRRSPGGHWEDWFNPAPANNIEAEHKRYGYVALSRPKHLLILAVPKLNTTQLRFFSDLGFVIENLNRTTLF